MDDINLEDAEGEESTAREMAQRALQRSQQAARQAASQARNAARSFARNVSQRLGSGYQRVPTSEVELEEQADTAIETDAAADVESAEAAEGSAEAAFEDVSPTDAAADTAAGLDEISAEEAAQITGDETLADGGEVLADSLGVDAADTGAIDASLDAGATVATDTAVDAASTALTDAGVDVAAIAGTDAAVDLGAAAGTGALTGAFNPGTDIADVFTFGLASAVGAAVGAGVGAGVGAAISSANKPKSPKPGIAVLPSNDVSNALKKLQKEPTKNAALITMIESAQSNGQPIFRVTTDGKKTLLQAQLSQDNLAKAVAAVKLNPDVYKGQSQYILQAMGLNKALATGGTAPSSILRQHMSGIPDVTPPPQALQRIANTTLQSKIQSKMQPFLTAKGNLQSAQQRLLQSRDAASNAATVAQARYAKYMSGVNQKNQRVVAQYNQHLMSSLQQYAPKYDAAVAQQNLQTAEQATKPTQLLQFNVQQSYQAQKQTYTPQSTQLPARSGQSSGKA